MSEETENKNESVLETRKILWDFKIQMDHPIPVRRPNRNLINKKKKKLVINWILSADYKLKMKESENQTKYLDLVEKVVEYESDRDTNHSWSPQSGPKEPEKEIGGTGD